MNLQAFLRGLLTGITGGGVPQVPVRRELTQTPEARARKLLLSMLNEKQRRQFECNESFRFTGSHGTTYELTLGHVNNIRWYNKLGKLSGCMCAHPDLYPRHGELDGDGYYRSRKGPLPDEDVVLGQFLALVTDEHEFLSHAVLDWGDLPRPAGMLARARAKIEAFEPWY